MTLQAISRDIPLFVCKHYIFVLKSYKVGWVIGKRVGELSLRRKELTNHKRQDEAQ